MRATKAVIHTENLKHNLDSIRELTGPEVKICLAVKADAYGHGAKGIGRAAQAFGVEYLAVAAISEAEILRKEGITIPIIILSPVLPEEVREATKLGLEAVISTGAEIENFISAAGDVETALHLKIDTGMGRIGCSIAESIHLAETISRSKGIRLAGLCTHFPVSDSSKADDREYTKKQIRLFNSAANDIKAAGINPGLLHAANSGAILNYPEAHLDMVRPGIFAYGFLPGGPGGLLSELEPRLKPKPIMSFESKLIHIKKVSAGTDISYGRIYTTERDSWIGTIPAGYADGYNRLLSNKGWVLINGSSYKVAGTVCMDQLMVDLGPELKAELFDRAVLFGFEDGAATAEELTDITGSIPYELLCAISERVPRVFV
ncbi:MAG: alanine racemase [Spirochaetales bacterium]|nr:alanine racemase [Spirochaetales bacterium]